MQVLNMAALMFRYLGFRTITSLAGVLPRAVQYGIACRAADAYYLLSAQARESMKANLRAALGPGASETLIRRETRSAFHSFGMYLAEFFGYRRLGGRFIDEHVVVVGRENLDVALANGRGAIFCSGHYSNWEFGATIVAHLGYPITIVAQMHADPRTNALFVAQRSAAGVNVVPSEHGAKGALRALRQNHAVALMGDRPTGGPVLPVQFFGRTAYVPQGPWRIALTSGAALLPTFMSRRFNGDFTLEIGAPLQVPSDGTLRERMTSMAQAWMDCFARRLQVDPSQWAAFYNVWNTGASAPQRTTTATDEQQGGVVVGDGSDREGRA
jgi:KDO2-lipid IV(A) lauroyltransferase